MALTSVALTGSCVSSPAASQPKPNSANVAFCQAFTRAVDSNLATDPYIALETATLRWRLRKAYGLLR